jgi:phenylpropionate dioxygenase-like ring-hydroxylating dioxygenase large terminal subunit
MEAHESRRGVHLGKAGHVVGDAVQCDVDGWRWQPDGTAVTPDGRRIDGDGRLRVFPATEVMDLILVWYDEAGGTPAWDIEIEPETQSPDFYPAWPHGTALDPMSCQPQIMAENIADVVHVHYAHRWLDIPRFTAWQEDGPILVVDYEGQFGSPRGPVEAVFGNKAYGFGVLRTRMNSLRKFVHILCPTPIDTATMDVRLSAWVERAPGDAGDVPDKVAMALIKAQHAEVLGPNVDRTIWENQAYLEHPGFRNLERQYVAFRKWSQQFYPGEPVPNEGDVSVAVG